MESCSWFLSVVREGSRGLGHIGEIRVNGRLWENFVCQGSQDKQKQGLSSWFWWLRDEVRVGDSRSVSRVMLWVQDDCCESFLCPGRRDPAETVKIGEAVS